MTKSQAQNNLDIALSDELNPKIDFLLFEHLGIVEQLNEVLLSCQPSSSENFEVL